MGPLSQLNYQIEMLIDPFKGIKIFDAIPWVNLNVS